MIAATARLIISELEESHGRTPHFFFLTETAFFLAAPIALRSATRTSVKQSERTPDLSGHETNESYEILFAKLLGSVTLGNNNVLIILSLNLVGRYPTDVLLPNFECS